MEFFQWDISPYSRHMADLHPNPQKFVKLKRRKERKWKLMNSSLTNVESVENAFTSSLLSPRTTKQTISEFYIFTFLFSILWSKNLSNVNEDTCLFRNQVHYLPINQSLFMWKSLLESSPKKIKIKVLLKQKVSTLIKVMLTAQRED